MAQAKFEPPRPLDRYGILLSEAVGVLTGFLYIIIKSRRINPKMAVGNLYKLIDRQVFLGEEILNIYHYEVVSGTDGAEDLILGFITDVLPYILPLQHANCEHVSIEALNYQDEEEFHVLGLEADNIGEMTGETLPRFNALGFKYARASRAYRNGSKRIGGLAEGIQDGGVFNPAFAADLTALTTALAADLSGGDTSALYSPKIAVAVGPTIAPAGGDISDVVFTRITTQNSRKR